MQNSNRHNWVETEAAIRKTCRDMRFSIHTENSYTGWIKRYAIFSKSHACELRDDRVRMFLSELAPNVGASTQHQSLCALVWFYKRVLHEPLGDLGEVTEATRPRRLPDCMTDAEVRAVMAHLRGEFHDMAALAYGGGLRLHELVSLRVKDLDFERGTVVVRQGKGAKDRATFLPASRADALRAQLRESRLIWERDRRNGVPGVFMPDAMDAKMPHAGEEWAWHWVWPSRELSYDPRSGLRRRHHVHETGFQKAVKAAGDAAGLSRRVHPHLFRHAFATAFLTNGGAIHELKELMGHASIQTTEIYLHVIGPCALRQRSPLDAQRSNVLAFPVMNRHSEAV